MSADFLTQLKNAKKSCIVSGNLKKVHYDFGNGKEMAEEYNTNTNVVTRRAWRRRGDLGAEGKWEVELGDPDPSYDMKEDSLLIRESSTQPVVSRRTTRIVLEWRIRNLSYPLETYSVEVDEDSKCLIVKTSNKKYYKVLPIPELQRINVAPKKEDVHFTHKFNTLIITYKKPKALQEFERSVLEEVNKIEPKNYGDMDCKPS